MSVKAKTLLTIEVSTDQQSITTTDDSMCSSPQEQLTEFMEKLSSILTELKDDKRLIVISNPHIQKAVESLEADYRRAKALMIKNSPMISPTHDEHIEQVIQSLARGLGLVLFASHDVVDIAKKAEIEVLRRDMMKMNIVNKPNLIMMSSDESEFSLYDRGIVEEDDRTTLDIDGIVEEDDGIALDVDDVIVQIKYGDDKVLKCALHGLKSLVLDGMITKEGVHHEDMIPVLFNRLSSSKAENRLIILRILQALVSQDDEHKEKMADMGNLSILVKSLGHDLEEQKEAVGLLVSLLDVGAVRRRVGRIQGCIVMLVAIFNGDDQMASHDAANLLNSLSGNTQYALHMAEAGYFKPLVHYLNQGSDMSKILMATAVSRMELTDQNRTNLGQDGAIEPLVKMFTTGNLEAKQSSLNALNNLSVSKENVQRLIKLGIVATLLQLLFSVTSVLMTLREPASAILAKIAAQSEAAGIVLLKQDVAQQMISLLHLTSPVIQCHLLEALNAIAACPNASKVRKKMKENGAIRLLLPFLTEGCNTKIKNGALNLIYVLSNDMQGGELMEQLEEMHLNTLINVVSSSSTTDDEKAAAVGILSNFPVSDKNVTDMFMRANLLPILVSILTSSTPTTPHILAENIAAVLIRFTLPSDKKLQQLSAENGVINVLVKLLTFGSIIAKCRAATSLAQLSQNSLALRKSRKSRWFSCAPPHPTDTFCQVHDGNCSTRSTFCLVKSGAMPPLVEILQGNERAADEAALSCLATLLQDEIWENGSNLLVKMSCVQPIIKILEQGMSLKAQEMCLWILERIFRVEAYRVEYGESAQVVLIDLAQNGDSLLKPTVAKLLAQLELLQSQSSYF